jgi:hypothetical protein
MEAAAMSAAKILTRDMSMIFYPFFECLSRPSASPDNMDRLQRYDSVIGTK